MNGSFEDPASTTSILSIPASGSLTGWSIASGSIEVILGTYWQVSDGNQSIDLNGVQPGSIYQDVVGFTIGHAYRLFFDMSANPLGGANLKTVQASAGGTTGLYQFDRAGRVG